MHKSKDDFVGRGMPRRNLPYIRYVLKPSILCVGDDGNRPVYLLSAGRLPSSPTRFWNRSIILYHQCGASTMPRPTRFVQI